MTQTLPARDIDLRYLIDNFGIDLVLDGQFFPEWQEKLPQLTDLDYEGQLIYIKYILTHAEYDKENWKYDPYF